MAIHFALHPDLFGGHGAVLVNQDGTYIDGAWGDKSSEVDATTEILTRQGRAVYGCTLYVSALPTLPASLKMLAQSQVEEVFVFANKMKDAPEPNSDLVTHFCSVRKFNRRNRLPEVINGEGFTKAKAVISRRSAPVTRQVRTAQSWRSQLDQFELNTALFNESVRHAVTLGEMHDSIIDMHKKVHEFVFDNLYDVKSPPPFHKPGTIYPQPSDCTLMQQTQEEAAVLKWNMALAYLLTFRSEDESALWDAW
eukprot:m.253535 g.253535  ORF g.253535 m.253535 type:complete len:252 (+) comp15932_c0_seq3:1757-2512(+)